MSEQDAGQKRTSEVAANATPSKTEDGFVAHTPGPWFYTERLRGNCLIYSGGIAIATTYETSQSLNRMTGAAHPVANAAFTVRAVNAHDDLLAALKNARDAMAFMLAPLEPRSHERRVLENALRETHAAIAKAETLT